MAKERTFANVLISLRIIFIELHKILDNVVCVCVCVCVCGKGELKKKKKKSYKNCKVKNLLPTQFLMDPVSTHQLLPPIKVVTITVLL